MKDKGLKPSKKDSLSFLIPALKGRAIGLVFVGSIAPTFRSGFKNK